MKQSDKERAQTERLENDYEVAQSPVIQKITNICDQNFCIFTLVEM